MKIYTLTANASLVHLKSLLISDGSGQQQVAVKEHVVCPALQRDLKDRLSHFLEKHGIPDAITLYTPVGGDSFPETEILDQDALIRLRGLISRAPLHLPPLLEAIQAIPEALNEIPRIIAFGTSFFHSLPDSERFYAIDGDFSQRLGIERTGYHGLYHQAAMRRALHYFDPETATAPPRILSVCLEPRLEATAIHGTRPILVTGGATPVEGLPGQTTCGEIDPGIVLILSQLYNMPPEQIGEFLTRESGLTGLLGRRVTVADIFMDDDKASRLAREIILYKILQIAGSSLALMGGLEAIVFSGRYAAVGEKMGAWLKERLSQLTIDPNPSILLCEDSFESLLAKETAGAFKNAPAT